MHHIDRLHDWVARISNDLASIQSVFVSESELGELQTVFCKESELNAKRHRMLKDLNDSQQQQLGLMEAQIDEMAQRIAALESKP